MRFYFVFDIVTVFVTSASLSPSKTTRLNETFAVRFVVVNGFGLVMTKLKVVPLFGDKAGLFFVPPITHLLDWPIILPCSSSRKQMARADTTGSAKLLVIASDTMVFCAVIFGGVTLTAS